MSLMNSFVAFMVGGNRAVLKNRSGHLKIDQGVEEEKEQQNGMTARGTSDIYLPDELMIESILARGVEEEEQQNGMTARGTSDIYLPDELMIESILARLPVRSLSVCYYVSKYWYNTILNDSRFALVHHIQNKHKVFLVFHLINVTREDRRRRVYFFSFSGRERATDIRILLDLNFSNLYEIVGFCNGLACLKLANKSDYTRGFISVLNQNRGEMFVLTYLRPAGGYIFLGHGFGFDSLSQVYKVVIVFTSEANKEFLCMVFTLGTMSWRKILTSTLDISPPPGSSPFPSPMLTRVSRWLCRQATFCGGDLFWRTKNEVSNGNNYVEMLLSFDLHNEKIHFIQLPTECTLTSTSTTERQYLADDHLLEFKGYPCIAHSERITTRSNTDHRGHRCNYKAGVCCCCYKVHMYILKDKHEQVWTREETFDVQIMDQEGLLQTPICCLIKKKTPFYRVFDTSAAMPPTRLLNFSDQVVLYWFNGERLIFYNLQEKHLKVVECSRSYPHIFQTKMNENLERIIGDDDNIYCPSMDYQLHAQVENIVSLETFIPKEAKTSECDGAELKYLFDNNLLKGWLTMRRKPHTSYAFS